MQHNYKNVQLAPCSILYLPLLRQPTARAALVRNSASPTRSTRSHRIHPLRTRSWVNLTENGWSGFQIKKTLEETCWYNRAKHAPAAPSVSFLTRRTASSVRPIRCVLVAVATGAPQWGGTELLHPWYLRAWFCSSFVCSSPYLFSTSSLVAQTLILFSATPTKTDLCSNLVRTPHGLSFKQSAEEDRGVQMGHLGDRNKMYEVVSAPLPSPPPLSYLCVGSC